MDNLLELKMQHSFNEFKKYFPSWNDKKNVLCPFHEDVNPSMSISKNNEGLYLFHCFACGIGGDIINLIEKKNKLSPKESIEYFIQKYDNNQFDNLSQSALKTKKIIKIYDYTDEVGNVLYQKIRYEPKTFRIRQKKGDTFIWNKDSCRNVLYNLPAILQSELVFIVEGEKDADNLNVLGLTATTNIEGGGSGNNRWKLEYSECLKNKNIVIIPDNDKPGQQWLGLLLENLINVKSLKVINLDVVEKGDVSDWLESGGNKEYLLEKMESAVDRIQPANILSDFPTIEDLLKIDISTEFIIDEFEIIQGSTNLIYGESGCGKSIFALLLANGINQGNFLGIETEIVPCLYCDFENPLSVLQMRAEEFDIKNLHFLQHDKQISYKEFEEFFSKYHNIFIILDTLSNIHTENENDNIAMTKVFAPLKILSKTNNITWLVLHHAGKSGTDRGASAIKANCDSFYQWKINPEKTEFELITEKNRFTLSGYNNFKFKKCEKYGLARITNKDRQIKFMQEAEKLSEIIGQYKFIAKSFYGSSYYKSFKKILKQNKIRTKSINLKKLIDYCLTKEMLYEQKDEAAATIYLKSYRTNYETELTSDGKKLKMHIADKD